MIGILDSGVGGLSIYREIKKQYPDRAVIYLADKKNFPYGTKTDEELLIIVRNAVRILIEYGANIVVLACNSATVATVRAIRSEFEIPIIGIEPAVKQACATTKTSKIGVLATSRTVEDHDSEALAPSCKLYKDHNDALVEKIENNFDDISDEELVAALEPFISKNVDVVVLGCTHYHFVKERLEGLFPKINFLAPEEAVARRLVSVIRENNIELGQGNDIFLCSADKAGFEKSLVTLLGVKGADIREV